MRFAACINYRQLNEFIVVGLICLVCCSLAFPTKVHHSGDKQRGVIPLRLFMSQLQVDLPDYHSEALSGPGFSGGTKRKRHGHGHHSQQVKQQHGQSQETDTSGSCCPTVEEIVEPVGGKSKSGHFVELFQTEDLRQQFHEISCAPNVADKQCRFVSESVVGQSRCVQQYSYSYALVRDFSGTSEGSENSASGWRFEHIRVRSGCSCIISPS